MSSIQDISDELNIKVNEIRLSKNHPLTKNNIFILLEGNTDIKLFRNFFNYQTTYIEEINGKEKVIEALEILQNEGFLKILGIKDADFDHLESYTYDNINLFITDYADMEIHMIESSAFESLINEFSKKDCHKIFLSELKNKLYSETLIIGCLRWFNDKQFKENGNYLLRFKGLNFNNFIDVSLCNILINEDKLLLEILIHSGSDLTTDNLKNIINNLKSNSDNYQQICNGHDIAKLLAYLFNHKDNSDKSNINQERIEEALRLSYNLDDFKKTKLYNDLNKWQQQFDIQIFKT
jgi:hypothetical protein